MGGAGVGLVLVVAFVVVERGRYGRLEYVVEGCVRVLVLVPHVHSDGLCWGCASSEVLGKAGGAELATRLSVYFKVCPVLSFHFFAFISFDVSLSRSLMLFSLGFFSK